MMTLAAQRRAAAIEAVELKMERRDLDAREARASAKLEHLDRWGRKGATLYGHRGNRESWHYKAVFPLEAVPQLALDELDQLAAGTCGIEDCVYLEEWVVNLPTVGAYESGPGRPFCHGPSVYRRGRRVVVSESGGLDI